MEDPSRTLVELGEKYLEYRFSAEPQDATALGFPGYDHLLADLSPEGTGHRREELLSLERGLADLPELPPDSMQELDRRDLLAKVRRDLEWDAHAQALYLGGRLLSPQVWFLHIPPVQPLTTPDRAADFRERVRAMGPQVDQILERLEDGHARGVRHAAEALEQAAGGIEGLLGTPTEEWSLVRHGAEYSEDLGQTLLAILDEGLRPSLARLRELELGVLSEGARPPEEAGLASLPRGEEEYAACLHRFLSIPMDPEEIRTFGLEELERIRPQVLELGRELLGVDSLDELRDVIDRSPSMHFQSSEEILETARTVMERGLAAVPRVTSLPVDLRCQVLPIPEETAPRAQDGYAVLGPRDGTSPGTYFVNTHRPETRRRSMAEYLAFHEAAPGHLLQGIVARDLDLPPFRKVGGSMAYVEGWALYAEALGDELDLYTGPSDCFGYLLGELWRAARLVLDTGLHARGWSPAEALDFALGETPCSRVQAETEIHRFLRLPGQACTYKIGHREILRLREEEARAAGSGFDLRHFHDHLLGLGPLGLGTLAWSFRQGRMREARSGRR